MTQHRSCLLYTSHIFVEHAGRLYRLNKKFDNERQLEDIIQKIVGKAGKEVNQANPCLLYTSTEEGLGFTGRGEGIASQAICLLEEV